jgi:hypothetical protein
MILTEREHAEIAEFMGFDKDYVHPEHRETPPVVYQASGSEAETPNSYRDKDNSGMKKGGDSNV